MPEESDSSDKPNDKSTMSSSQTSPNKPDPARTRQSLARKAKVTSAADAISKRVAQQEEDNVLRPGVPVHGTEHIPSKSNDTQQRHTRSNFSNTQQRPVSNGSPFQPDLRFTPINSSARPPQNAPQQPIARPGSNDNHQPPLAGEELDHFDNEFNGLTPSSLPPRQNSSALTSANWRVKSNQQKIDPPALNVQAPVFDPSHHTKPLLVIPSRFYPHKITKRNSISKNATRSREPPITYTRSPPIYTSTRTFDAKPAPKEMPRPQPTDDYLNQAVDDPVRATAPQRLLIILDLNGTCVYRGHSSSPGIPRPHLQPFLKYLFEYHDVMVWSSAMPKNVNKMCRNIFTPEQFERLTATWTREDLRLGRLIATKIKGHKMLTWVWVALNPHKKDKTWWYDQTNTVLIDDTRLKAAAEPWNLLEVPEWDGHDQKDEILEKARKYIDENLRWTRDVSQYLHKHPPTFSTPVTVSRETGKAADSLADDIAMLDLSKG